MSITPEAPAKTLTQLVATEIKVQMARADIRQSELARKIGKNEQWLSVRLRGRQPFDINDMALVATGLGIGIHDLLPSPQEAAQAANRLSAIPRYLDLTVRTPLQDARPRDNRPPAGPASGSPDRGGRTAYVGRRRPGKAA